MVLVILMFVPGMGRCSSGNQSVSNIFLFTAVACLCSIVATYMGQRIAKSINDRIFGYFAAGTMILLGLLHLASSLLGS